MSRSHTTKHECLTFYQRMNFAPMFSKFFNRVILLGNHFSGNWHPKTFRETEKTTLWFHITGKYTSSTLTDMFIRQKIILELTSWNIHVKYMWTRIQSVQTALSCPKPFFRTIFPLRPSKETPSYFDNQHHMWVW